MKIQSRQQNIYLIQVGTPPIEIRENHGDLSEWFKIALKDFENQIEVIRVFDGDPLPQPDNNSIGIITGSWAMVTDKNDWSETTALWIRKVSETNMPLFGICYGHQLIAYALGGKVDYHPYGIEMGRKLIKMHPNATEDILLKSFPNFFTAYLTHQQTVTHLPIGAISLASSDHDLNQIVRYSPTIISTQFHPEFTQEIMQSLIEYKASQLHNSSIDLRQIYTSPTDSTLVSCQILINWIRMWGKYN